MHRAFVLALLAVALCAASASAAAASDDAPSASQWGSFRGQRADAAAKEHKRDLAEAKKELKRAVAYGKAYCQQTKQVAVGPKLRLDAKVALFKSLVSQRRSLLRYHEKRVRVYATRREYFSLGPLRLRDYVKTCGKPRATCVQEWCSRNKRACESWKLAAREYRDGQYEALRAAASNAASDAARRLRAAQDKLKRASQKRDRYRSQADARAAKCSSFVRESLRPQYRRINALKQARESASAESDDIAQRRNDRQLAYKEFNFTRCKKLGGQGFAGRHHAYRCRLDSSSSENKAYRFNRCKKLRKPGHFRCWK